MQVLYLSLFGEQCVSSVSALVFFVVSYALFKYLRCTLQACLEMYVILDTILTPET